MDLRRRNWRDDAKRTPPRSLAAIVTFIAVVALGCSAQSTPNSETGSERSAAASTIAVSSDGPRLQLDHWHAAFGIFICDRYLPNFTSTAEDLYGIHAHEDGLVHIHPFVEQAAGKNAVLRLFTDSIGMTLTDRELKLDVTEPQLDLKDGDACADGRPGKLRVVDFSGPHFGTVTTVKDPLQSRFTPDRVFAFVFAPDGVDIPPPPSATGLANPIDMPPPPR
jgi:hypothetical protein